MQCTGAGLEVMKLWYSIRLYFQRIWQNWPICDTRYGWINMLHVSDTSCMFIVTDTPQTILHWTGPLIEWTGSQYSLTTISTWMWPGTVAWLILQLFHCLERPWPKSSWQDWRTPEALWSFPKTQNNGNVHKRRKLSSPSLVSDELESVAIGMVRPLYVPPSV